MTNNRIILIDIVVLPPQNMRKRIGAKMESVARNLPNFFVVDNKNLIPHLSLWHTKTSVNRIDKMAQELNHIAKEQKPIKINSSGFHALEKYKGCVEFGVKNNKALALLRQKVFQSVWIFKSGKMPEFASFLKIKYSKAQLEEIKKYGRTLGFQPHFTMGWLGKEADIPVVVKKMQKIKFSFLAREIYICEINKWWQVKRIIKKINF